MLNSRYVFQVKSAVLTGRGAEVAALVNASEVVQISRASVVAEFPALLRHDVEVVSSDGHLCALTSLLRRQRANVSCKRKPCLCRQHHCYLSSDSIDTLRSH